MGDMSSISRACQGPSFAPNRLPKASDGRASYEQVAMTSFPSWVRVRAIVESKFQTLRHLLVALCLQSSLSAVFGKRLQLLLSLVLPRKLCLFGTQSGTFCLRTFAVRDGESKEILQGHHTPLLVRLL
mmetsp:Transcript_10008/g.14677  ORF Transcript_10008/g.14677 Transcript_10008/m.14677 type:complete len:128 (-) Transcript_10008:166-549(-)